MLGLNLLITSKEANEVVRPVVNLITTILPAIIGVVGAVGLLYCIILGVKYAKADDPQEHEKAKKGLRNAIVGFVLIFALMIALSIALPILQTWMLDQVKITL